MDKNQFKSILRKISREHQIDGDVALVNFFMEQVVEAISKSDSRELLTMKGGLLLSNILGLSERTTLDADFAISNFNFKF